VHATLVLLRAGRELLDNALAYTRRASVTVRTGLRDNESVLEVEDNGPASGNEAREGLRAFYRIAATEARLRAGLSMFGDRRTAQRERALSVPPEGRARWFRAVFPRLAGGGSPRPSSC